MSKADRIVTLVAPPDSDVEFDYGRLIVKHHTKKKQFYVVVPIGLLLARMGAMVRPHAVKP